MIEYVDSITWSVNPVATGIVAAVLVLLIISPAWLLPLMELCSRFNFGLLGGIATEVVLVSVALLFLSPLGLSVFPSHNISPEEGVKRSSGIALNEDQINNLTAGKGVRISGQCFISYKEEAVYAHLSYSEGCVSGDDTVPSLAVRHWGG